VRLLLVAHLDALPVAPALLLVIVIFLVIAIMVLVVILPVPVVVLVVVLVTVVIACWPINNQMLAVVAWQQASTGGLTVVGKSEGKQAQADKGEKNSADLHC